MLALHTSGLATPDKHMIGRVFSRFLAFFVSLNLLSLLLLAGTDSHDSSDLALSLIRKGPVAFEHVSLEQGLSQSSVSCIIQDRRGFMWFGTADGLNRYDGYEFRVYRSDPDQPNSLSDHFINSICEDSGGAIWIGTQNGLNRFDPEREEFARFLADPENPGSLSNDRVRAILEDRFGLLWIGTAQGLNLFDRNEERFVHYGNDPDDPASLSHDSIYSIHEGPNGTLWVGTARGVNEVVRDAREPGRVSFVRQRHDPGNPYSLAHKLITAVLEDRSGNLWIGTPGGLCRAEPDDTDRPSMRFVRYLNDPRDPESISSNQVKSIFEDGSGVVWVGTWAGGLNRFDRDTGKFTRYQSELNDLSSLSHDVVNSIYEDRSGILWIGTNGGLNKYDRLRRKFAHYSADPNDPNSLSQNSVWSICEDRAGNVWIGTEGGGLDRLVPGKAGGSSKFIHHRCDPGDPTTLSGNFVTAVYEDREGMIWIGTDGYGLNRILPGGAGSAPSKFLRYDAGSYDPGMHSHYIIISLYEDRSGDLWIGTGGGGLKRLVKGEKLKPSPSYLSYENDPADPASLSHDFVYTIYEDRQGTLWIGTNGGGLNEMIRGEDGSEAPSFRRFQRNPDDPASLSDNRVMAIHEDREGTIWIGTFGGGLNRFDRATQTFSCYTVKEGLPSNVVYAVLEDGHGNLWLSTNVGLSKFDPVSGRFRNYDVSDGLQSNEFNSGAYCCSRSGLMFFGGINGFNVFHPDSIRDDPRTPSVVLTDLKLFNRSVPIGLTEDGRIILSRSITETGSIELAHDQNVVTIEFAALHYSSPERNCSAYRMEGFDRDWNYVGTRRSATYTNLPPGKYEFTVISSNHDHVWNEAGTSLAIVITPPFWQTFWFRAGSVLLLALSVYGACRRRIRQIETKRKKLEEQVEERTRAADALKNALDEVERLKHRLERENVYLQDEIKVEHNFENIITRSPLLKRVLRDLEKVASTDATVLVLGESGTGKELLTRAIHNISPRGERPLVKVNCSTLPANLIESELFGHDKGAFTGAISRKSGRFELADGGTIFLDEIGDLPLELQAKLLRVLQEGEFERLGGSKTIRCDVRVIAATNRNLEKEIENRRFREDLYYRLNVFPIKIPPLRERKEDIPLLVNHFVRKFAKKTGKTITTVSQDVLDRLTDYDWPGNVRELENIIERAVIITPGEQLVIGDWLPKSSTPPDSTAGTLEEVERDHIIRVLKRTNWRVSGEKGAAKILGINAKTLDSRMRKLNIRRPGKNSDI